MTPTPDALTRVARAICRERQAKRGLIPCHQIAQKIPGWGPFCEKKEHAACQALARAAINAMENRDE